MAKRPSPKCPECKKLIRTEDAGGGDGDWVCICPQPERRTIAVTIKERAAHIQGDDKGRAIVSTCENRKDDEDSSSGDDDEEESWEEEESSSFEEIVDKPSCAKEVFLDGEMAEVADTHNKEPTRSELVRAKWLAVVRQMAEEAKANDTPLTAEMIKGAREKWMQEMIDKELKEQEECVDLLPTLAVGCDKHHHSVCKECCRDKQNAQEEEDSSLSLDPRLCEKHGGDFDVVVCEKCAEDMYDACVPGNGNDIQVEFPSELPRCDKHGCYNKTLTECPGCVITAAASQVRIPIDSMSVMIRNTKTVQDGDTTNSSSSSDEEEEYDGDDVRHAMEHFMADFPETGPPKALKCEICAEAERRVEERMAERLKKEQEQEEKEGKPVDDDDDDSYDALQAFRLEQRKRMEERKDEPPMRWCTRHHKQFVDGYSGCIDCIRDDHDHSCGLCKKFSGSCTAFQKALEAELEMKKRTIVKEEKDGFWRCRRHLLRAPGEHSLCEGCREEAFRGNIARQYEKGYFLPSGNEFVTPEQLQEELCARIGGRILRPEPRVPCAVCDQAAFEMYTQNPDTGVRTYMKEAHEPKEHECPRNARKKGLVRRGGFEFEHGFVPTSVRSKWTEAELERQKDKPVAFPSLSDATTRKIEPDRITEPGEYHVMKDSDRATDVSVVPIRDTQIYDEMEEKKSPAEDDSKDMEKIRSAREDMKRRQREAAFKSLTTQQLEGEMEKLNAARTSMKQYAEEQFALYSKFAQEMEKYMDDAPRVYGQFRTRDIQMYDEEKSTEKQEEEGNKKTEPVSILCSDGTVVRTELITYPDSGEAILVIPRSVGKTMVMNAKRVFRGHGDPPEKKKMEEGEDAKAVGEVEVDNNNKRERDGEEEEDIRFVSQARLVHHDQFIPSGRSLSVMRDRRDLPDNCNPGEKVEEEEEQNVKSTSRLMTESEHDRWEARDRMRFGLPIHNFMKDYIDSQEPSVNTMFQQLKEFAKMYEEAKKKGPLPPPEFVRVFDEDAPGGFRDVDVDDLPLDHPARAMFVRTKNANDPPREMHDKVAVPEEEGKEEELEELPELEDDVDPPFSTDMHFSFISHGKSQASMSFPCKEDILKTLHHHHHDMQQQMLDKLKGKGLEKFLEHNMPVFKEPATLAAILQHFLCNADLFGITDETLAAMRVILDDDNSFRDEIDRRLSHFMANVETLNQSTDVLNQLRMMIYERNDNKRQRTSDINAIIGRTISCENAYERFTTAIRFVLTQAYLKGKRPN